MNNKALKEMIFDEIKRCENRRRGAFVRIHEAEAVLNLYDEQKTVLEELLAKVEEMEDEEMRLIDADALKRKSELVAPSAYAVPYRAVSVDEIESSPTIEAEPVRHGEWTETREALATAIINEGEQIQINIVSAKCTACGKYVEQASVFPPYVHYKLCPWCGAKMDGKEE